MLARCSALGYKSVSDYLRHLHKAATDAEKNKISQIDVDSYGALTSFHLQPPKSQPLSTSVRHLGRLNQKSMQR